MKIHRVIAIFSLIISWSFPSASAQVFHPVQSLNQPYTQQGLFNYCQSLDSTETSIDPVKSSFTLSCPKKGIELEFNFNMILSQVRLYSKGSRFLSYSQPLPFRLRWGLNQDMMATATYGFVPDSTNPYLMTRELDSVTYTAYFYGNKFSVLHIASHPARITRADAASLPLWGLRVYPEGNCVSGDCEAGKGTMLFGDKTSFYEGQWKYGFPNGAGKFTDPEGNVWDGIFVQGFPWGKMNVIAPESFVYEGDMYMGKRNGQGKIAYKNGEVYEGEWHHDLMEGKGVYYFSPSFNYKGQFVQGKFEGNGVLSTPEGVYEGTFKNGKPHGKGTQKVLRTQATLSGNWVNGKKEGVFQYHDPLTGNKTIKYKNDQEVVE